MIEMFKAYRLKMNADNRLKVMTITFGPHKLKMKLKNKNIQDKQN